MTYRPWEDPAAPNCSCSPLPGILLIGNRACLSMVKGKVRTDTWTNGQERTPECGGGPVPQNSTGRKWQYILEKGGELCKELLLFHSGQMPTLTGSLGLRAAPRRYLANVT